jgi:hypothetical protein
VHPNVGEFAGIFIAFYIAHGVADHWIQTDYQAANKGRRDRVGVRACACHVATYTTATAVLVAWTVILFGLHVGWAGFVVGQLVSAVTHYWADRRYTMAALSGILRLDGLYRLGAPRNVAAMRATGLDGAALAGTQAAWDNPSLGTGAYALDQWWHLWWLFIAAIVTVAL